MLGLDHLPALQVPESIAREGRGSGLRKTEVCRLEEAELDLFVLDDGDDKASGVKTIGEKEKGE